MKCQMCLYVKIDGKYYPFCSPRLCMKCDGYADMPGAVLLDETPANVDA